MTRPEVPYPPRRSPEEHRASPPHPRTETRSDMAIDRDVEVVTRAGRTIQADLDRSDIEDLERETREHPFYDVFWASEGVDGFRHCTPSGVAAGPAALIADRRRGLSPRAFVTGVPYRGGKHGGGRSWGFCCTAPE